MAKDAEGDGGGVDHVDGMVTLAVDHSRGKDYRSVLLVVDLDQVLPRATFVALEDQQAVVV